MNSMEPNPGVLLSPLEVTDLTLDGGALARHHHRVVSLFRAPCRAHELGGGSPLQARPDKGSCQPEGKGVHLEVESEGSRRQSTGLTNRNRIRGGRIG